MLNSEIERALIGSSSGSDIIVHCNNWFLDRHHYVEKG